MFRQCDTGRTAEEIKASKIATIISLNTQCSSFDFVRLIRFHLIRWSFNLFPFFHPFRVISSVICVTENYDMHTWIEISQSIWWWCFFSRQNTQRNATVWVVVKCPIPAKPDGFRTNFLYDAFYITYCQANKTRWMTTWTQIYFISIHFSAEKKGKKPT